MPQHHPYSRRALRQRRDDWLRRNAKLITILTVGAITVFAFITVLLLQTMPSTSFTWWLLGVMQACVVAAYLSMLYSAFLAFDGEAIWHVRGAWGEDNTRSELQRAKRKRLVWGWVDSVALQHGDIDHLVVTRRGGLVAIDSKWRNRIHDTNDMARAAQKVRLRAEGLTRDLLRGGARGSRRARVNPLGVTSIVVLWGAAQHDVPDGAEVDGIAFIPGRKLTSWLAQLDGQPVDQGAANEVVRDVKRYRALAEKAQATRASARE
jgi:hypothetical protein